MSKHISWNSIELLHNVITTLTHLHNFDNRPFPTIHYKPKVKLHGTNCAVQIRPDGIFAQSRTIMLSVNSDLKGFAKWVCSQETYFRTLPQTLTIFGEWCGPGVEGGTAISKIKNKIFAVFALQYGEAENAYIVTDPEEIQLVLGETSADIFVLPWENIDLTLNYSSKSDLEAIVPIINDSVVNVEQEDPWVKKNFGISGLGEGLVFYPISLKDGTIPRDPTGFTQLMFKAKGEKHRTANTKTAVQVEASVVGNTNEFVTLMVTEARLFQGLTQACNEVYDMRNIGKFITWVSEDVRKESKAELAASNLTWEQVQKAVQTKARDWYKMHAAS
ncbi:MAG: hypothetical protein HY819_11415 [Acidobacteria bacterium]|nr:hypothetical protein [Acidobacteriota bacterium]